MQLRVVCLFMQNLKLTLSIGTPHLDSLPQSKKLEVDSVSTTARE